MEDLNLFSILISCIATVLILKYLEARNFHRQLKQGQLKEDPAKTANCIVEYDPSDPNHNMLYIFDRNNKKFLTQARTIKEALRTLVKQGYETITFHPDYCPPEIFEQTKNITANDFAKVKQ
jgi:hypothetical protein